MILDMLTLMTFMSIKIKFKNGIKNNGDILMMLMQTCKKCRNLGSMYYIKSRNVAETMTYYLVFQLPICRENDFHWKLQLMKYKSKCIVQSLNVHSSKITVTAVTIWVIKYNKSKKHLTCFVKFLNVPYLIGWMNKWICTICHIQNI